MVCAGGFEPPTPHFQGENSDLTELNTDNLERGRRIELLALAWKAKVLPLYEPRKTWWRIGESNSFDLRARQV